MALERTFHHQHGLFYNKAQEKKQIETYPRFYSSEIEDLFDHYLQLGKLHVGKKIYEMTATCPKCYLLKEIIDVGVMTQLNCILQTWEKKLKNTNISSILVGYMTENQAKEIFETIKVLNSNTDPFIVGQKRIDQMLDVCFTTITNKNKLEISVDMGNMLPFIMHCDVQFQALSVRYNELINPNGEENKYLMVSFLLLAFHLNGLVAFLPSIINFLWAELYVESLIALWYSKELKNVTF